MKDLTGILLRNNDLTGWDFSGQNLTDANFEDSTLTGVDLTDAVVAGADFEDTTALGFTKEQLYSTASYKQKDLQGINLEDNDMASWNFAGQDLSNADVQEGDLSGADLTGANLSNANFRAAILTGANLVQANLANTDFAVRERTGRPADLSQASLTRANLSNGQFTDAILTNADLTGASLKSADFSRVVDLTSVLFNPETVYNQWTLFPDGFEPSEAGLTFVASPPGDFDGNDVVNDSDVDLLGRRIRDDYSGGDLSRFDINNDQTTDHDDLHVWVKDIARTWYGDANLDSEFDSLDLVQLLQAGQYEDGVYHNSAWATGDWDADGEFGRSDLILALQDGGYGQGLRAAVVAVPEPSALALVLVGFFAVAGVAAKTLAGAKEEV
jgi:hypothetical protein